MMTTILSNLRRVISGNHPARLASAKFLRQLARIEIEGEIDRLKQQWRDKGNPLRLSQFDRKVFSQYGEDGIIAEIFSRIGITNHAFIEFGVGNGRENNTVYLLVTGWSGLWIEIESNHLKAIRKTFVAEIAEGRLQVLDTAVSSSNVESLFKAAGAPLEPDLLSIDIDGNDYYVWRAIKTFRPRVVVCEYNSLFPPAQKWRMCESENGVTISTYFGASLRSLTALANEKGYQLVGCSISGANAFFVRDDLVNDRRFAAPFTPENHYEPPRYHLYYESVGHPAHFGPAVLD